MVAVVDVERIEVPESKDDLFKAHVAGGPVVYVWPKKGYSKVYATYATRFGSVDCEFIPPGLGEPIKVPEGVAHFLEHKVFEEVDGKHAFERFGELGASSNAYTDYTHTAYLFSTTANFEQCLEVLLDFVGRLQVTDESVEREKGIIQQEILMYADMPEHVAFQNLMQAMYHRHPVRMDIAGTVESVRDITREHLELCHRTFYHPSSMVLFVAGDVEPVRVLEQVERFFSRIALSAWSPPERVYPEEPCSVREKRVEVTRDVSRSYVRVGFKDPRARAGLDGQRLLKKAILAEILVDLFLGKSSHLYERLYDQGLIDERFSCATMTERDYGAVVVAAESDRYEQFVRELLDGIESLRKSFQSGSAEEPFEEGFKRVVRKTVGQTMRLLDSPEAIAYEFNKDFFNGFTPFDRLKVLHQVKPEDAWQELAHAFDQDRCSIAIVRPQ